MPDPQQKGLLVDVLRPAHGGDNTNFGISSKRNKVVLVGAEVAGETEPSPDAPPLLLTSRDNRSDALHAEPPGGAPPLCVGYMFGGNFVWSANALFPSAYPIPIHDRLRRRRSTKCSAGRRDEHQSATVHHAVFARSRRSSASPSLSSRPAAMAMVAP
jgi:hypothetical protein